MAIIFPCKSIADHILENIERTIDQLENDAGRPPRLVVYNLTDDPCAESVLKRQKRDAKRIGIDVIVPPLTAQATLTQLQDDLFDRMHRETKDGPTDGIVFLKPPQPDAAEHVNDVILPHLDVDCAGNRSRTDLARFRPGSAAHLHLPPTAISCLTLFNQYQIPLAGKRVALFGKGYIGSAIKTLLERHGCHVEVYDSHRAPTHELETDIVIAAANKQCIHSRFIPRNAAFIDVSRIHTETGVTGAVVDYETTAAKVSYITPQVTRNSRWLGSVGNLTTAHRFNNVLRSYKTTVKAQTANAA